MLLLDAAYVRLSSSSTFSTTETYIRPLVARIPTMRDNRRHHHQEQPDLPSTLELGVRRLVSMTCIFNDSPPLRAYGLHIMYD